MKAILKTPAVTTYFLGLSGNGLDLFPLFAGLKSKTLNECLQQHPTQFYERGDTVFSIGEMPQGVYFVRQGLVRLETLSDDGKTNLCRFVPGGEMLGFRALAPNEPYHVSAVVHEPSQIHFIPRNALMQIVQEAPELMFRLSSRLAIDLREADERRDAFLNKEAGARIAEALIHLDARYSKHQWTRKEIAEWAGTTPETVIRFLARLKAEGIIRQDGRFIRILDEDRLLGLVA